MINIPMCGLGNELYRTWLMRFSFLLQMKERVGIRQLAVVLQKELTRRFEKVLQPTCDSFDPIFVTATFLDPRYRLLMTAQQVTAAKDRLLREVN